MGRKIRCPECGELYNSAERLEDLRDAEGMCLGCDAEIEVEDWDDVLASYEEEEDEAEAAVTPDDEEFDEFGKWSADDDASEEAEAETDDFSADSSYGATTEFEEGDEDEDDEVETDD